MNKNERWQKIWEVSDAPIFEMGMGAVFCLETQMRIFGYVSKEMLLFARNEVLEAWYTSEDLLEAGKHGKTFYSDRNNFIKHTKNISKLIRDLPLNSKSFERKLATSNTVKSLVTIISELSGVQIEVFSYFNTTNPQFISLIEEELTKYLKSVSTENATDLLVKLTTPEQTTILQQEQIDFYKCLTSFSSDCDKIKKSIAINSPEKTIPGLYQALKKHAKRYGHLSGNEGADHWDVAYYLSLASELLRDKKDIIEELRKMAIHENDVQRAKLQLIRDFGIDIQHVHLARVLSDLSYYRLELRVLWSAYFRLLRKAVYQLANVVEIPAYDILSLYPFEISPNISKSAVLEKHPLDRYKSYIFYIKNNVLKKNLYGDKAIKYYDKIIPHSDYSNLAIIEGTVGFPGVVEGTAYCFNWGDKDFNVKIKNMPKGAVLVIGNTRPSLMPAIRKASAIVTDEGGITSHAAIVSRELKIPCIIGTGFATKSIKTGDVIKVDAMNGVVLILK